MKAQLLNLILQLLRQDPAQASADLAALGVRPGVIERLRHLASDQSAVLAESALLHIGLDYQVLASIHTADELLADYLRHGATNDLIIEILGLSVRMISAQRAALGIPSQSGRPVVPDERSTELALAAWRNAEHLPKAARLLAVHDKLPMWPLSSLYLVLRGK